MDNVKGMAYPMSFDDQYQSFCRQLDADGKVSSITREFGLAKTDVDRCRYLLGSTRVYDHLKVSQRKHGAKSSDRAASYRGDGNKSFQKKDYKEAWRLYSESICHAVEQSGGQKSDLALAYANRSAALFHLEKWESSLSDIRHALDASYPEKLRYKLLNRRGHCLAALGRVKEAVSAFEAGKEAVKFADTIDDKKTSLLRDADNDIKKYTNHDSEIRTERRKFGWDHAPASFEDGATNKMFPSLSSCCEVAYTEDKGRHLVASRDISPGELILVEKPYASVLLPECRMKYCYHCYQFCLSPVPCLGCASVSYCSEQCRDSSWNTYHRHECGLLDFLYKSGVGKFGYLALRTVLRNGIEDLRVLHGKQPPDNCDGPVSRGCGNDGVYRSGDYHAILSLVTHDSDRSTADLFRRAIMAVFLMKIALTKDCEADMEFQSFVAGLILSHLQSFPCNAHEITTLVLDPDAIATSEPRELGAGIYATLSLFNHSCDPAVNRNFYADTCVVRAIKSLKRGQEITDNYGAVYAVQSKPERQDKLRPQYFFTCQCEACTLDWPLYPDISDGTPVLKCDSSQGSSSSCPHRGTNSKGNELQASRTKYSTALELLLSKCDVESSLPVFLDHLAVVQSCVELPWRDFNNCQEALKQCWSIRGNCHLLDQDFV